MEMEAAAATGPSLEMTVLKASARPAIFSQSITIADSLSAQNATAVLTKTDLAMDVALNAGLGHTRMSQDKPAASLALPVRVRRTVGQQSVSNANRERELIMAAVSA